MSIHPLHLRWKKANVFENENILKYLENEYTIKAT